MSNASYDIGVRPGNRSDCNVACSTIPKSRIKTSRCKTVLLRTQSYVFRKKSLQQEVSFLSKTPKVLNMTYVTILFYKNIHTFLFFSDTRYSSPDFLLVLRNAVTATAERAENDRI